MKKLNSKSLMAFICLFSLALVPVRNVNAAEWKPTKPVTIIVCYAPGGGHDTVARIIAPGLEKELGVSVIVKNVSGAAGTIGAAEAANAAPDGHTVALMAGGPMIGQPLLRNLPYKVDSWQLVSLLNRQPLCVHVREDSRFKTIEDLVKEAKEKPNTIISGTTGVAATVWLGMTGLNKIFGIQTRHMVDRSGAESFKSLASGTVDVIYETEALSARYGSRGLLRLAPDRSKDPALSYIPSMGDIGQNFYMYTWEGISAPKDTPKHIVKRLSDAIGIVMAQPKTQEMFKQANMSPAYMPSDEFAKFYADTVDTFTMLLKEGGVIK